MPMQQFTLSLILCFGFLVVVVTGGLLIVVCTPRAGLETLPQVGGSVAAGDEETKRQVDKIHPAKTSSVDTGLAEDPKVTEPAPPEGLDHAADPAEAAKTVENNKDVTQYKAQKPRGPGKYRRPAERWQVHSVTIGPQVFLIDGLDSGAVRRVALPAPVEQRFVLVSISMTWEGRRTRTIYFEKSRIGSPTFQLAANGGTYDPIGRLIEALDPLAPLTTDQLVVAQGQRVDLDIAFLMPNHEGTVSLIVDGQRHDTFELPPPHHADLPEMFGIWHRVDTQLHPLRFEDPLIDALADPGCRLLWITANGSGQPRLNIPSASVSSDQLLIRDDGTVARLTLNREQHHQPAWVRAIDGGSALLVYFGEESPATFMYERSRP